MSSDIIYRYSMLLLRSSPTMLYGSCGGHQSSLTLLPDIAAADADTDIMQLFLRAVG